MEWTADGITWDADPRHAELIRKSYGVTVRSVVTPGIRDKADDVEGEVAMDKKPSDRYRANTMHADTSRVLKRLAHFLGVRPRLV